VTSASLLTRPTAQPVVGVSMVVGASVLFALNGTVSKLMLQGGFDAPRLTAFRATGAFAGLLILGLSLRPGPRRLALRRSELPMLTAYGLAGFFAVPMLYFVTISRLPVGIGLLFEYTAPFMVALWVRFGQRHRVKPRLWVGLVLCLCGLACVAQIWAGGRSAGLDPVGVVAGFTCAALLALYYLLGSRSVASRDPLSLTCWAFGVSAVAGALLRPWWGLPAGVLAGASGGVPMWLLAVYLVVGGTIVPYLLIASSLRHLPPTSTGIVGMVEPVLAAAIAWLVLREVLSPAQILGGLLVLIGVVLAETARTAGPGQPEIPPA
jgi:drug/metabolite transporter (DMT)-like permease